MIYVISPYSDPDPAVREQRFRAACIATAALAWAGFLVISPIVHGHPLVEHGVPGDWSFWRRWGSELLARCDEAVVLQLDGWIDSVGVQAEIALARELGKPLLFLEPTLLDEPGTPRLASVATEVAR